MYSTFQSAQVTLRSVERSFYYRGTEVLNVEMEYPVVSGIGNRAAAIINGRIRSQVNSFWNYVRNQLYREAVSEYRNAMQNGYPFREFSAVLSYNVEYNRNCHLSIFREMFQYTGGAHGTTEKRSDTWNIRTGRLIPISDYFERRADYKNIILTEAIRQADADPSIYFENYAELMEQNFDPESYYLTDAGPTPGLVIYYQEYEIAPYASGTPIFTIPYSMLKYPPSC
ncbi:MAG TPA: DUF3298 and DUF4163 domain-containing protein [Clostridiales bacterium]|nr:DUF3298 and DUF4163 domain-containing protein [Clostridiales bacterium]HQA06374.1 DUF3298 and DUF4163 domain-containing protein [Clostridiales bacterium]HXK82807.1 DUF3298 and DUF4163 domain-containing protein [Clostridiales bacterium]